MKPTIIDISGWQVNDRGESKLDWEQLKADGVTGVIVKIGEGGYLDQDFVYNINKAIDEGMRVGVYYYGYANNISSAVAEANKVIEWINEYMNGQCPELGIWYDAESDRMLTDKVNVIYPIANFISTLKTANLDNVGCYIGYRWLAWDCDCPACLPLDRGSVPEGMQFWLSQYNSKNDGLTDFPELNFKLWQFTSSYKNNGENIDGNIEY